MLCGRLVYCKLAYHHTWHQFVRLLDSFFLFFFLCIFSSLFWLWLSAITSAVSILPVTNRYRNDQLRVEWTLNSVTRFKVCVSKVSTDKCAKVCCLSVIDCLAAEVDTWYVTWIITWITNVSTAVGLAHLSNDSARATSISSAATASATISSRFTCLSRYRMCLL